VRRQIHVIQIFTGRDRRFFSSPKRADRLWNRPRALYLKGNGDCFPGGNSAGRECDHLPAPLPRVDVMNEWSHMSTLLCLYCVHTNNFDSALHMFVGDLA
jgi:hypothetical protein